MGIRGSNEGSMPFAIIAVTLLLIAGTYVSVCAYVEDNREGVDNIINEIDSADTFSDEISRVVSRGAGEIVAGISKDDLGSLLSRYEEFDRRIDAWVDFIFPMTNGVSVAELKDHDIRLISESLRFGSDDGMISRPTYLMASGTVDVSVRSVSGSSTRTIDISTDGTSSLPFLMESMSLFEISAGNGSLLYNMISHQLTSLAQYRVLQGFGSRNVHGEMGTDSIITEADVTEAFNNAIAALEMLNFRTTSDGTEFGDTVDLAGMFISKNGTVEIDVSAIYAQALGAMIDDILLKWMDYLMFGDILNAADWFLDMVNELKDKVADKIRWISKLFGKNPEKETAGTYIRDIMEDRNKSESEYRYMIGSVNVVTDRYEYEIDGRPFILPSLDIVLEFPKADVVKWKGWDTFVNDYRKGNNQIKEGLKGILNGMCMELMSSKKGMLTIDLDKDRAAFEQIMDAISSFMAGNAEGWIAGSAVSQTPYDPMFASMYERMVKDRDSLFRTDEMRTNAESTIRENVMIQIEKEYGGAMLDRGLLEMMVNDIMSSQGVQDALSGYDRAVDDRLLMFRDELNSVKVKETVGSMMISMLMKGLVAFDLVPSVDAAVMGICREMADHISLNPSSAMITMPSEGHFTVSDGNGTHSEFISVLRSGDVVAEITPPSRNGGNVHHTDIPWDSTVSAAYSAMFTVSLKGDISYEASSSSALSQLLGIKDAKCSGSVTLDMGMDIPVLSGWALMGADYEASTTVMDDTKMLLLKVIEPLIGPLMKIYSMMRAVFELIGSAMFEISFHTAMFVQKVYNLVYGVIDQIHSAIEEIMNAISSELGAIMELSLGKQTLGFRYRDLSVTVTTNLVDAIFKSKTVLKIAVSAPIRGIETTAGLEIKKSDKGYSFAGSARMKSDTWSADVTVDPFMKVKRHLVEINGLVRNTDIHVVIPEMVQYDMLEFRLSDIPAVGRMLSNIPLPIPGMKGEIDAGVQLKYNLPYKHGLVINEFESNPPGNDIGKEWVELYNSSSQTIDLDGYKFLMKGSGKTHKLSGTISQGERKVITLPRQMLNNGIGQNGNGEKIVLLDADENEVDSTPWKTDSKDDDKTWQRTYDGSTSWVFKKATKGKPNGGQMLGGNAIKVMIQNCLKDSLVEAFGEIGTVTSSDGISSLLERTMELAIGKMIDTIAGSVTEASIFIEVALTDYSGTGHSGLRLSLSVDGDLVRDGLKWMVGQIRGMMQNIDNPSGLNPKTILSDDIWIKMTVFGEISAPQVLFPSYDERLSIGIMTKCNISSVCTLLGREVGTWKAGMGIVFEDIPAILIPKNLTANTEKKADLWLIHGTFERAR